MKFSDFLKDKKPENWQPDQKFKIIHVEKSYNIETPSGRQPLDLVYFLVKYIPGHEIDKNEYEGPEILDIYPVAQFDQKYIPASVLVGPSDSLNEKDKIEWAWREYSSKNNHFHLLSKQIKNQIEIECEKKAEQTLLDFNDYESWESD